MKKWVIFFTVLILMVIAGIGIVRLRKHQLESIKIEANLPIPVDTAKVEKGEFYRWMLYTGSLESNKQATVRARIQGQITGILKREGDSVKKGDVLIELDGINGSETGTRKAIIQSINNQKNAISSMEKTIENLKNIYNRDLNLYNNKAISKQALELSENRLKQAKINLENLKKGLASLKEKLSFFTIKAPFEGVVAKVIVNKGDVVMPSMPLVQIENKNKCKLVVGVSSDDIPHIKVGAKARILYFDKKLDCKVSRVYPSAKDMGIGFCELDLPYHPFNLPLGSKLSVEIATGEINNAKILPDDSVLTSSDNSIVFKIVNNKVVPVKVKILGSSSCCYAVEGEIKEGDLVARGSDSLLMRLQKGTHVIIDKGE